MPTQTYDLFAGRIKKLQAQLTAHSDALLVSYPSDVRYYSGFQILVPEEREAVLLVCKKKSYLIKQSFSPFASACVTSLNGCSPHKLLEHCRQVQIKHQLTTIFFDASSLTVAEYDHLKTLSCQLSPYTREKIWQERMVKDDSEIKDLIQAGQVTVQALSAVIKQLKPGMTEKEVKQAFLLAIVQRGAKEAFPTIVCFGAHTALPHHQPGLTKLTNQTAVLIDCGAMVNGYRSDMSRSFWFGDQPSPEYQQVKKLVCEAYQAALDKLTTHQSSNPQSSRSKLQARDLDQAARSVISLAGYGDQFIHTTGHGVGLEIHEPPSLNWRNQQLIKPNMVITIEPGIYLEGKFGYRHENTVLVTEDSARELTT